MPLSWNEIRQRAIAFSRDWADASRERAESQTFWNEFFHLFGRHRRTVANFEETVRNNRGGRDFIDLLWPGVMLAEHKSKGRDLGKAHTQAVGYINELINDDREPDAPRYIVVSDFARIAVHDLDPPEDAEPHDISFEFPVAQLHEHIQRFAFVAGYETRKLDPEDPANIQAAELLANLHDRLEDGGYTGHDLQRFMVRVLFCLFAEDTGIFEPNAIESYIRQRTAEDGSDLGLHLARIFQVLNTREDRRQNKLDEGLAELPWVNGRLFEENLAFADFNAAMREALLQCCRFKWDTISPAVFGSLFQSIMQPKERRQIGAHYTSERDIIKLLGSLFLDQLTRRLDRCHRPRDYDEFLKHLGGLRFLDPACGCGNFLVIAYRELRRLEMEAIQRRYGDTPSQGDIRESARMQVGQFYGIEIEEWPALIAEVGMWLMDHQMNNELFARFGTATPTVPLTKSPTIRCANALRIDWNEVVASETLDYVMGNPPFIGSKYQTAEQRAEVRDVWGDLRGVGTLDYVSAWYAKATDYMHAHGQASFVSTNSITQGEQVGVIWPELFNRGIKITHGHRTFPWTSEARGKAHVHVVIVGFSESENQNDKRIHDYGSKGEALGVATVANISPYLTDGSDCAATNRGKTLAEVPEIGIGNKPIDGGYYLFEAEEYEDFVRLEPSAKAYFHRWFGSKEFLQGKVRYCLWVGDAAPQDLRSMPHVLDRIENVRKYRRGEIGPRKKPDKAKDMNAGTVKLAATPTRFHVVNMPSSDYLVVPKVSSERRDYIPIGYMTPKELSSDLVFLISGATIYHFGVLHSAMHMAWVKQVCGRLKSDFRYSAKLVYNNFPWPEPTDAQRAKVEQAAQGVLDARAKHPDVTLADLYDPLTMPANLAKAHAAVDRAVDRCYRKQPFPDERRRFEHLFGLYERLSAPLTGRGAKRRGRKKHGG